jgi:hypothetical protein
MLLNKYSGQKTLSFEEINYLRTSNKITDSESVSLQGDLLVAENVNTSVRRIIGKATEILSESHKKVLLG